MAPRRRLRSNGSVLVSVSDRKAGYLVFRFDVKRLFSDDDDGDKSKRQSRRKRRPREVLPLPLSHVACFGRPIGSSPMDLVASPGGDKIVAATTEGHIMVYDITRSQYTYDHDLGRWNRCPLLLALSSRPSSSSSSGAAAQCFRRRRRDDDMSMLVTTARPNLASPDPYFEALRLTSGGRRLQPLPVPPPLLFGDGDHALPVPTKPWPYVCSAQVTSCFVGGGRVWLSVKGQAGTGTYSLDMAAPKLGWRREGSWVLPNEGRGVYAPDLGLLLGFTPGCLALCAIDMEARPPVIRQQWRMVTSLFPTKDEGYSPEEDYFCFGGLAYLGGGRICVSWSSPYRDQGKRMILALTAFELTMTNKESTIGNGGPPELLLRKRRSRCYRLPPNNKRATVLPVL